MTRRVTTDTIAAVASPFGEGAVALLRVSGPAALAVAGRVCAGQPDLTGFPPRRQRLVRLLDREGRPLDEVLLCVHRGPASYTGEDVVEISCHGGMLVTRRALETLLAAGARAAEPGEFTQRAFLNGRMDLTQAEAVMDLIRAQTDLAIRAAGEQLEGRLGQRIHVLRELLLSLVAHVEAYIDFPDEDIDPETGSALLARMDALIGALDALLATAGQGRILREGVRTVIYGEPNVGKSSLLNLLLGQDRAIVSETPGTTRDTIEESLNVRGLPLRLTDTAGLRASLDPLENAGMAHTRRTLARADLALHVVDGSQTFSRTETPATDPSLAPPVEILVLNKSDLGLHPVWAQHPDAVPVSCRNGTGMERLADAIYDRVTGGQLSWSDSAVAINARHQACLQRARESLRTARESLRIGASPEFTALDLRGALDAVGAVVGQVDTEDILGKIFSTFCIGK